MIQEVNIQEVLSPTLFNIAMMKLPALLEQIPNLEHNLYADDITIWCCRGSPGWQEHIIPCGLDTIRDYAETLGLECSPQKSEYIVISEDVSKRAGEYKNFIKLRMKDAVLPRKNTIRILGFFLQDNGKASTWVQKLTVQLEQILAMIRRITRQRRGMKEHELR